MKTLSRQDPADHFMRYLTGSLLVRTLWIAEEDAGTELAGGHIALNGQRVGKLAAPVGQDDRKERLERLSAKSSVKRIEYRCHRPGGVMSPQKGEHVSAFCISGSFPLINKW